LPGPTVPQRITATSHCAASDASTPGCHASITSACAVLMLPGIVFAVGPIESVSPSPVAIG
jgi:hypothetical protein